MVDRGLANTFLDTPELRAMNMQAASGNMQGHDGVELRKPGGTSGSGGGAAGAAATWGEAAGFRQTPGRTTGLTLASFEPGSLFPPQTFSVIISHLPPWVVINKMDGDDPGNLNQTRQSSDPAALSGALIDWMSALSGKMGVDVQYFYPCLKSSFAASKTCGNQTTENTLAMLSGDKRFFQPPDNSSVTFAMNAIISRSTYSPAPSPLPPPPHPIAPSCILRVYLKDVAPHTALGSD